jgi:hypothetical protein
MDHNTLVPLVMEMHDPKSHPSNITLAPTVTLVKQCIEGLLDKEYLVREGVNIYVYVA